MVGATVMIRGVVIRRVNEGSIVLVRCSNYLLFRRQLPSSSLGSAIFPSSSASLSSRRGYLKHVLHYGVSLRDSDTFPITCFRWSFIQSTK